MLSPHQKSSKPSTPASHRVQALYARYSPLIRKRCRRLLGNTEAADDATQEIFIRVLRHVENFDEQAYVLPWINRICTNYCLNMLRNGQTQPLWVSELPEELDEGFEDRAVSRQSSAQFLEQMAPETRYLIEWVHLRNLPQTKIARMFGVSRRTLTHRLAQVAQMARQWNLDETAVVHDAPAAVI